MINAIFSLLLSFRGGCTFRVCPLLFFELKLSFRYCILVVIPLLFFEWELVMDCNPLSSSVHGILQAKILEWVARPEQPLRRGSALSRLGAELELRRSGSSLGPSQ